jgi:hypothetical protein
MKRSRSCSLSPSGQGKRHPYHLSSVQRKEEARLRRSRGRDGLHRRRHGRVRQRQGVHSVPGQRTAFPRVVPQLPRSEHHGGSPPASRPGPAPPPSSCAAARYHAAAQVPRRRPVHAPPPGPTPPPRSRAAAQFMHRRHPPRDAYTVHVMCLLIPCVHGPRSLLLHTNTRLEKTVSNLKLIKIFPRCCHQLWNIGSLFSHLPMTSSMLSIDKITLSASELSSFVLLTDQ